MIPLSILSVALFMATLAAPAASLSGVGVVRQGAVRCTTLREASGHTANTTTVAYSSDGKSLFTGSIDGVVVQWDTATGQPVHTLLAAEPPFFRSFNIAADGKLLLVDSRIYAPKLLDMTTGEELPFALKPGHHARSPLTPFFSNVAFSPDGKTVAILDPWLLCLFDRKTGTETGYLAAPDDGGHLGTPTFSTDGKLIAVSAGRQLLLVNASTYKIKNTLRNAPVSVTTVAFSPDGRRIAAGGGDGDVILWDVATGMQLRTISAHQIRGLAAGQSGGTTNSIPAVRAQAVISAPQNASRGTRNGASREIVSLTFSPNGSQIVTSSRDGLLAVWDTDTGAQLHAETGTPGAWRSVTVSPDGQTLAVSGGQSPVLWDLRSWQSHTLQAEHVPAAVSAAFAPDGKTVAVGMANGAADLWDTQTGQLARTVQAHEARVRYTAFSPDGNQLITADDKQMRFWSVANGQEAVAARSLPGLGYLTAYSRDGRLVATSGAKGTAEIWDTVTAQRVQVLKQEAQPVTLAFSTDGNQLAVSDRKGDVTLWNTLTGQVTRTIINTDGRIFTPIAFTGDGSKLADGRMRSSNESQTIMQVWNTRTGQEVTWLGDKHSYGDQIAFSPDGRWLAMNTTPEHSIVLFDVVSRKSVELKGHMAYVTTLTFSPDSKTLLSTDRGGAIKLWSMLK
jgi:WD40 repeat protein